MKNIFSHSGQAATEFVAVMPFFLLLFMIVLRAAFFGLHAMVARHDVMLESRVEYYNRGESFRGEFVAMPAAGFSDEILRGGDTPSPYCRDGDEYNLCGYPQ